jgi:hypothetical protein
MTDAPYDTLARVYDWLVPEARLTPQGSAAALGAVVDELAPGMLVLDCAAGRDSSRWGSRCAGSTSSRPTPATR